MNNIEMGTRTYIHGVEDTLVAAAPPPISKGGILMIVFTFAQCEELIILADYLHACASLHAYH